MPIDPVCGSLQFLIQKAIRGIHVPPRDRRRFGDGVVFSLDVLRLQVRNGTCVCGGGGRDGWHHRHEQEDNEGRPVLPRWSIPDITREFHFHGL